MKTMVYQRKNNDTTIFEMSSDTQPEITSSYSFLNYTKVGLALVGTIAGATVLANKTGLLSSSSSRSSDEATPGNTLDNPYQLINPEEPITFTDNSLLVQPRHTKRAEFGGEFQINTYTILGQERPYVVVLGTDDFVVVWESDGQDGDGMGIYGQHFSSTGAPQGSEFQINTYTTLNQWYPSVASLSTGDFVVVWQSSGQDGDGSEGIYGQRYSSTGASQGSEFQINTYTTLGQDWPSITPLSSGDFVVVWDSNGQDGSGWGVYGQRYSSTGASQGSEFQINTYTTDDQGATSVAVLAIGDFVVVWDSNGQDGSGRGIYGQRFSNTGVPQGLEFQINTYTALDQEYPSVASLSTGGFVVVWESDGQDGSRGIYGQRFSNTGVPQGLEFQINTYTTSAQQFSSVAALTSGDFVVVWQSDGQDGSNDGTYGQRYSSTGIPQGPEFQINSYTTNAQRLPSVAALTSDDFVVVWQSDGQDGDLSGIYGCIYFNNGIPPALINNALTINEGETIILNTSNISAFDSDNSEFELTFTVSNMQYGQFERVSNAGVLITNFTQQDIIDGAIQFVHDGSENAPSYDVSVSDGTTTDGPASANIAFFNLNDKPVFVNNALAINEEETVILSTLNLSATDSDSNDSDLIFTLSNVQYGQFEYISNASLAITNFTQQEIIDGTIQFVHDGSENQPSYDVSVSDDLLVEGPATANIFFTNINDMPSVVNNPFILQKGETFTITSAVLNSIDSDNSNLELAFNIINNNNGYFHTTTNDTAITQFTLQQIIDNKIMFVSDGAALPEYILYVTDGGLTSASESSTIVYIAQNQLVIKPSGITALSSNQLDIQTQIAPADLLISVPTMTSSRFEKSNNQGTPILSFTLAELNAEEILFMHIGATNTPRFTLSFEDVSTNYTFPQIIDGNAILNYPPEVLNPVGTLRWPLNKISNYTVPATLFIDRDGQQLQFSVRELNGNALPQWVQFDSAQNILAGTPTTSGLYSFKIIASDPYNETADDRFYIDVRTNYNTATPVTNVFPIVAAVAGGAALLAGSIAAGILYFKKSQDRKTRQQHKFAQRIRHYLKLKDIDNFKSEDGQRFVQAVQTLSDELLEAQGLDITNMNENRLDELARNIAASAKNKITPDTTGLWKKSKISIQEFEENIKIIAQDADRRLANLSFNEDDGDDVSIPMHTM